jgi:hypothetical protein
MTLERIQHDKLYSIGVCHQNKLVELLMEMHTGRHNAVGALRIDVGEPLAV